MAKVSFQNHQSGSFFRSDTKCLYLSFTQSLIAHLIQYLWLATNQSAKLGKLWLNLSASVQISIRTIWRICKAFLQKSYSYQMYVKT